MSQKGEETDVSQKNTNQANVPQQPVPPISNMSNMSGTPGVNMMAPPSQFMPGYTNPYVPPYWGADWWNNYPSFPQNPSSFDMSFRDDLNKSHNFNQTIPNSKTTPSNLGSISGSNSQANKPNQGVNSTNAQASNNNNNNQLYAPSQSSFMPPAMPYMDPAMYQMMYQYQMAHMGPYGYPGMNPYMPQYGPFPFMGGQNPNLPDDQRSMQSFHFFDDTRSEKKLNLTNNRAQSIAGDFKNELVDHKLKNLSGAVFNNNNNSGAGLLMKDSSQSQNIPELNLEPTSSLVEPSQTIKRDENRITPQLHPLPHVRACFSLNSLVQIKANDPCEGQPALVDLFSLAEIVDQYLINPKNVKFINTDEDDDQNGISHEMRDKITIEYKLLQEFPGPLIKEHTSKAHLIQFCQKNIRECLSNTNVNLIDPQSHALLWDFLALLVRQNGILDLKTDISPLLLSGIVDTQNQWSFSTSTTNVSNTTTPNISKPISNAASSSSLFGMQQQQDFVLVGNDESSTNEAQNSNNTLIGDLGEPKPKSNQSNIQSTTDLPLEELHLNKLRQLLGAGQKSDAIELAVKFNMWPHALFLASSINSIMTVGTVVPTSTSLASQNTINSSVSTTTNEKYKALNKVKSRFINSLQAHDPIHTCYQLLIGRVPTVATNISKSEWSDWRRHLAMIVANVDESNKDLVLNSIKTMGDSLASNGRVAASHFCYLLADCQFGTFNKKSSKLVLIGSSHNQEFSKFCQINAIQATEIFEFAHSLSSSSTSSSLTSGILEHFVKYKLIYASRLLEYGFISEAYKYIEVIAKAINLNPKLHQDKLSSVFQLANRLRIYDSDFTLDDLTVLNSEPQWLQDLNNNYKKLHLNKLWHLLPAKQSPVENIQPINEKPIETNKAPKTEPNSNEITSPPNFQFENTIIPSSSSFTNHSLKTDESKSLSNPPQQQEIDDLNIDIKNINLNSTYNDNFNMNPQYNPQQSMPFNPISRESQEQNDVAKHIDSRRYPIDENYQNVQQNIDENVFDQNQQYHQQQQQYQHQQQYQQQQQQQQHQYSNNSTRKSSTSSNIQNPTDFQFQNSYASQINSNMAKGYPSTSLQNVSNLNNNNNTNNNQRRPSSNNSESFHLASATSSTLNQYTRSRQNSGNIISPPSSTFTPFNPYQQSQSVQKAPQNENNEPISFFDPNSSNLNNNNNNTSYNNYQMPKSQTFPSNNIKEELDNEEDNDNQRENKNQTKNDEDDDEFSSTSNKTSKKNPDGTSKNNDKTVGQNNQWWFKRAINYIKPATSAKQMVLPDDRKKTIIWDDKLKRYVNKDGSSDPASVIKPPPTFIPNASNVQQTALNNNQNMPVQTSEEQGQFSQPQQSLPSNNQIQNRFSLKSQNTSRRSYYAKVDVMADQSKKLNASNKVDQQLLAPMLSNMPPPSQLPPRFFVPPQVDNSQNQVENNNNNSQNESYQQHQNQQQQPNYQFQPQQQQNNQVKPQNVGYFQPDPQSNYQSNNYQADSNYNDETDSGTNSNESSNGSSQQSYSNESNGYQQNNQYYPQHGQSDSQDQHYSNI